MFDFLQDFPVGICLCKNDYTVSFWNSRLEIWTGISANQIREKDLRDFFPDIRAKKYADRIKMVHANKVPAIFSSMLHETLFKCPSLRPEHSFHNISILPNHNATEYGYDFAIVAEDVTALKKRSQDFQESKNFLSLVMNSAPDLIYVKDSNHKIVNANEAFLQLYSEDRSRKMNDSTMLHEEYEDLLESDRLAFEKGKSEAEETIQNSGGHIRTLYTKKIRFSDQNEQDYILSISRDITRQVKQQRVMNEIYRIASTDSIGFQDKMRLTLEAGRIYFGLDLGIISKIRKNKYEVIFASSSADFEEGAVFDAEGTCCANVFSDHSVKAWNYSKESKIISHPCYQNFGLHAYIGTTIFVHDAAYGTLNFLSKTPRNFDFSEQEKSLIKLIAQYIGNEIAKEELLQNLKNANSELEEFAYRTSHDLRSPLVSSIRLLDIAKKTISKGDHNTTLESLNHIQTSLTKLEALVKDILALTQTKNAEEEETEIDLSALVDTTIEKFAHMKNFERLEFKKELAFREPLHLKHSRITLIIENLISNAIKYQDLHEEFSYLRISSYQKEKKFVLKVEDNGLGIPKEQQGKLFQMFKRFHSRVSFGSGLGLYMMKKSALAIGGDFVFEQPKKGTIFKLLIPMERL